MISVTAWLFFCLWVSSLERHSEALLQPDTWARIEGCFLGKHQHVVEFSDAFFGQIDSIRFTGCFIDEGKRRGKTFIALFRPPEVKVGQTRLGGGKGQRHKIESIVSPFHTDI